MKKFEIDKNIATASTIHTDVYLNDTVFESSKDKIFSNTFHYLACKDEFEHGINVIPINLLENFLDEPLLVTKQDDKFSCLSNVCTHRGNLLATKKCKLHKITCNYHGRQFDLSGKFQFMPEFKEVQNFPTEKDNLHKLPLFEIGNLLFTSLTNKVVPKDFFGEMLNRMAWYPLDELKYRKDLSKNFTVDANWALYCENYLEGFHIPFVHPSLNEVLDFNKYTTELFRYSNLQIGIAKEGEASFDLPFQSPDNGKSIAAYYFWTFPNIMFNFYPWGLSLNVIEPISINKTKVNFYTFVLDESKYNVGAGSALDLVELEDEAVVENVQKGVRSRFYSKGRYAPKREQGTHHFHCLLAEFLNKS
jgi:choline monooxygenase